jgi:hypothetical protein
VLAAAAAKKNKLPVRNTIIQVSFCICVARLSQQPKAPSQSWSPCHAGSSSYTQHPSSASEA